MLDGNIIKVDKVKLKVKELKAKGWQLSEIKCRQKELNVDKNNIKMEINLISIVSHRVSRFSVEFILFQLLLPQNLTKPCGNWMSSKLSLQVFFSLVGSICWLVLKNSLKDSWYSFHEWSLVLISSHVSCAHYSPSLLPTTCWPLLGPIVGTRVSNMLRKLEAQLEIAR